MILAIGLGLMGLFALRRARRCHRHAAFYGYGYGYGGPGCGGPGFGWHGPWAGHGHGHGHGHGGRGRWMVHAALSRLDATPAQERAIVAELDKLVERVREAKGGLRDARGDLAAAVRGPVLDDAALGGALGRADTATAEVRRAAVDALRGIHAVLDDKQRERLASLLDRGGGGWWRGGPYR